MTTGDLNDDLTRACADGTISAHDADEVRRFADFLDEAGKPGSRQAFEAWRKHYPEDYAQAIAEQEARPDDGH